VGKVSLSRVRISRIGRKAGLIEGDGEGERNEGGGHAPSKGRLVAKQPREAVRAEAD
jgi:hypothetical protein